MLINNLKRTKYPTLYANAIIATLFIVIGLIFIVIIIIGEHKDRSVLIMSLASGGFFGAAASAICGILAHFLGTVDLKEMPLRFIESARDELINIGYYKKEFLFKLKLDQEEKELTIEFSSILIPLRPSVRIKAPLVIPPDKLNELIKDPENPDITYHFGNEKTSIGKNSSNDEFDLEEETPETCVIKYILKNKITNEIEDEHRTWCPVMDETIIVDFPSEKYDFEVFSLRGERNKKIIRTRERSNRIRDYQQVTAHFSHQGFKWVLKPIQHSSIKTSATALVSSPPPVPPPAPGSPPPHRA